MALHSPMMRAQVLPAVDSREFRKRRQKERPPAEVGQRATLRQTE
jgi:hypothetical protein